MPADLTTVHINRSLESLSVMLLNSDDNYLVPQICARRPVTVQSGKFYRYGREVAKKAPSGGAVSGRYLPSVVGPSAGANMAQHTVSQGSFSCLRYAYKELVADAEVQQADDPLSPLKDTAIILRQRVLNDLEFVAANLVADYDNYPAANRAQLTTGANGTSWNKASAAGTGSEPLTDIRTARTTLEKIIQREANTIAMSALTKYHLGDHDDFKNILQYTDESYVSGQGIPEHIRGLRVAVAKAVGDSAAEGAAFSGAYLFVDNTDATNSDIAIVCYVPENRVIGPRGFASFVWFDCADETTKQHGVSLRSWRDDDRRGWWVEAATTADIQAGIVDSNSKITGAYLIGRTTV